MTNWPGQPGPGDGQPDPAAPQQWPPTGSPAAPSSPTPGTYRQPWAAPAQPPAAPAPTPQGYGQPGQQDSSSGSAAPPWNHPGAPGTQTWGAQSSPPGWQSHPPTGAPIPPKSRKRLFLALAAVIIVGAVGFVGYRINSGDGIAGIGATQNLSAKDTVQQYLQALADGDAAKALSFGSSQPASTDLLTNDVLAKQNARMPVTNIRVLDEDTTGESIGISRVHVAVNFGPSVDDSQLSLKKNGDGVWKLDNAAIKLSAPLGSDSIKAMQSLTVFGKKLDSGPLYVFPGFVQVGSSNDYLDVTAEPLGLKDLGAYGAYLDAKVTLNDDGRQAVSDQLTDAFANCERSRALDPPGCPTKVSPYDAADAIDGTVTWGKADLSGVKIGDLSPYDMTVYLTGKATMSLSFQTTDGGTKQGTVNAYIGGSADMTTNPPRLKIS